VVLALTVCSLLGGCGAAAPSAPSPSAPPAAAVTTPIPVTPAPVTPIPATPAPVTPAPPTQAPSVDPNAFTVRTFYTTYVPDAFFAVDAAGNAYLPGGTEGAALVKVGPDGAPLARWAAKDIVPGQPDTVGGVVVDPKTGDVWLTDMTADKVVRLSSDLVEKGSWGSSGREPGMITEPAGITLDGKGNLVVVDFGNSRIETFNPDGTFLRAIAMPPGVSAPTDVAVDKDGTLLVSAAGSWPGDGRLLRLRSDGSVVRPYHPGGTDPSWYFPDGSADTKGGVLVVDASRGIVKLDATGTRMSTTLIPGAGDAPTTARISPSGSVYTLACKLAGLGCTLARFDPDGTGYTTASTVKLATPTTPPGKIVSVNGHDLHVFCTGTGSPTMLWISGSTNPGWGTSAQYLLGRLAGLGRVCTVDRLETGFSDRTGAEDMLHWLPDVDDIHGALAAAGESGPYVTVGHSYGGLLARIFAYRYRSEVQGVVAIDPAHEDQFDQAVPNPDVASPCVDSACPFAEDVAAVRALRGGPVAGSLGALPLVVIGHDPSLPYFEGPYDDTWLKLGADTAAASSNSVHVVATGSSHAIPFTQPGLVIEAVRRVVDAAKAADHTLPSCGKALTDLGGACK
jgi:pimeloyl-ACP methyl ester carboxylesterase/sugar lactone lactonase YvrE